MGQVPNSHKIRYLLYINSSLFPQDEQAAVVGRAPLLDAARGRGGGGRGGPRRQDHGHLHQEPQPQVSINGLNDIYTCDKAIRSMYYLT